MDNNNTFYNQEPNTNEEPPYQQQTTYQEQPYQQQPYTEEPMSVGDWMLTMLVMCIPCVNIIMMFVWAFSSSEKKSKSNYFKATLIWGLIAIGILIIFSIVIAIASVIMEIGF